MVCMEGCAWRMEGCARDSLLSDPNRTSALMPTMCVHAGWREPHTVLWSTRRFLSSPRGLKATAIGAVTFAGYEVVMMALSALSGHHESASVRHRNLGVSAATNTWIGP